MLQVPAFTELHRYVEDMQGLGLLLYERLLFLVVLEDFVVLLLHILVLNYLALAFPTFLLVIEILVLVESV